MINYIFDIDGTICFDGLSIDKSIIDALLDISALSQVIFASARHPRDVKRLLPDSLIERTIVIGGNGSLCISGDKVLFQSLIRPEVVDEILHLLTENNSAFLIDGVSGYYKSTVKHKFFDNVTPYQSCHETELCDLQNIGIVKFLVLRQDSESCSTKLLSELSKLQGIAIHLHSDGSFDLTAEEVNKYLPVRKVLNISDDYVCFGNDLNDLPLFVHGRCAIQIGHHAELEKFSHIQIPHTLPPQGLSEKIALMIREISEEGSLDAFLSR